VSLKLHSFLFFQFISKFTQWKCLKHVRNILQESCDQRRETGEALTAMIGIQFYLLSDKLDQEVRVRSYDNL
jgi:hypothetical protein